VRVRLARALLFIACVAAAHAVHAQDAPGMMLVAKPSILDPNFSHTVILVTQTPDGAAVGVIVNRTLNRSLAQLLPENERLARFKEPLRFGGPVETDGLFALFRAAGPRVEALPVAGDLQLALMPVTVETLIDDPPASLRFFVGYSGWGPGQLRSELDRGDWWVMEIDPDVPFRTDTRELWEELARRAQSLRAQILPGAPPGAVTAQR
jgi:putative transcriptional regulator